MEKFPKHNLFYFYHTSQGVTCSQQKCSPPLPSLILFIPQCLNGIAGGGLKRLPT